MYYYANTIKYDVAGTTMRVKKSVTLPEESTEVQETITKAWLTVMEDPSDTDNHAKFQKTITTVEQTTQGWLKINANSSSGELWFYIQPSDTTSLNIGQHYYYDIKYITSGNRQFVLEAGKLIVQQNVTKSTS